MVEVPTPGSSDPMAPISPSPYPPKS